MAAWPAYEERKPIRRAPCAIPAIRPLLVVWLAIFAVLVQLSASGACFAMQDVSANANGAFPICHAGAAPASSEGHGKSPTSTETCPFCVLHCHAALPLQPVAPSLARVATARIAEQLVLATLTVAIRLCLGGAPRGPPAVA